jgi:tetratricopeptide (TPR) repeat protein
MMPTLRTGSGGGLVLAAAALAAFLVSRTPARAQDDVPLLIEPPVPAPEAIREALARGDGTRALDLVRRELAAHPDSPDRAVLLVLEGRILAAHGDREEARAALAQVVPDSVWGAVALEQLHALALSRGEFTRAESLRTSEDAARRPALAARLTGTAAWTRGEIARASEQIAHLDLNESVSVLLAANVRGAQGHLDEADSLFDRVLADSSSAVLGALAHFGKGQSARRRDAHAIRVVEDDRAIASSPMPWAALDAGWALVKLARDDEARVRLVQSAREGAPVAFLAHLTLAGIQERAGERDLAKESLASAIEGGLGDPLAMARLGDLLARDGRKEDGIQLVRAAHEALPELAAIQLRLASLGVGTVDSASAALDPALRAVEAELLSGEVSVASLLVEPDSCAATDHRRLLRAIMHHLGGDWPAAIAWTEGAEPETPGLLVVRALSLEHVERTSEALAALEMLAEAGRSSWLADEHRARMLARTDPDAAAELWKRMLEAHGGDPRLRVRIAKLQEKAGDLEGAIEVLRETRKSGWLTESERVRLRAVIEDLEDLERSDEGEGDDAAAPPRPQGP